MNIVKIKNTSKGLARILVRGGGTWPQKVYAPFMYWIYKNMENFCKIIKLAHSLDERGPKFHYFLEE